MATRDILDFSQQLRALVEAGVPLAELLSLISEGTPKLRENIEAIARRVNDGALLSTALEEQGGLFPPVYCNMIAAGEAGGHLSASLASLCDDLEAQQRLRKTMIAALTYPTVVLALASSIMLILLVFVVPVFGRMFAGLDRPLPMITRIVLGLSDHVSTFGPVCGVFLILAVTLVGWGLRHPAFAKRRDRAALRIPFVGAIVLEAAIARSTRSLAALIGAGVPLLDSLSLAARTAGNSAVESALERSREDIRDGVSISQSLRGDGVFPSSVCRMIAVGERSGRLGPMLEKVSSNLLQAVESRVESAMAIAEPVMIVALGLSVGGLLTAIYLPIFQLGEVF